MPDAQTVATLNSANDYYLALLWRELRAPGGLNLGTDGKTHASLIIFAAIRGQLEAAL